MSAKKTPQELALIVQGEARTLVPALVQASEELDMDRQHKVLLEVFRKVDTKQNEFDFHKKMVSEIVTETIVVGQVNGVNIVKKPIIKSRHIGHLVKTLGSEEVAKIIRLLLVNINDSFNVKQGLTLYQMKEIAWQIIDECGDKLFIDELIYIFKKAKTDAQVYNKLDGSDIFRWIDKHYSERINNRNANDAEHKIGNADIMIPKHILPKAYEDLRDKYINTTMNISESLSPAPKKSKKKK